MVITNKQQVTIRIPPKLKNWLDKQAAKEGKKVSPYIESILEKEKRLTDKSK